MRHYVLFISWVLLPVFAAAQPEFRTNDNGYIYSPQAMTRLTRIVDSLNLRFKTCLTHPQVFAGEQARAHFIFSGKAATKSIRQAIAQGAPFDSVAKSCPGHSALRDLLVVRQTVTAYDGARLVQFSSPEVVRTDPNAESWFREIAWPPADPVSREMALRGRWAVIFDKDAWSGFYFTTDMQRPQLPAPYSRMAQYVDCLIDTTTLVMLDGGDWETSWIEDKKKPAIQAFCRATRRHPTRPYPADHFVAEGEPGFDTFTAKTVQWEKQNLAWLRDTFARTAEFARLLDAARQEAVVNKVSGEAFEASLIDAGLPELALDLKRRRQVWGSCSMDDSPRLHAQAIAELAAETVQWDIFLRAHLDILNDQFPRMTDGSYAWGRRGTYIHELEALDIQTLDLLFGICLRVSQMPANHYSGDIGRVGRALTEYSRPEEVEKRLTTMIADPALDDFNRLWMYNLYTIYQSYLPEGEAAEACAARVRAAGLTLPAYLAEKL